jgi:hypothetical protein
MEIKIIHRLRNKLSETGAYMINILELTTSSEGKN